MEAAKTLKATPDPAPAVGAGAVLDALLGWWRAGEAAGLAIVTATWSSAPRRPGAMMAVGPDGSVAGSVSGGCVESAVYDLCQDVAAGAPSRVATFGVSDDDAFGAGLTCGGTIELLITRVDRQTFPALPELVARVAAGVPAALVTRLDEPRHLLLTPHERHGTLGEGPEKPEGQRQTADTGQGTPDPGRGTPETGRGTPGERRRSSSGDRIDDAATDDGRGLLAAGRTGLLHYGPDGQRRGTGLDVLVVSFATPARMIVFGATEQAAATAAIGSFLGYRVTVCDARPVFATAKRFPGAAEIVVDWPHRYLAAEAAKGLLDARTVVCVLTHDPKFDVPLLAVALRLPIAYVGAMGSRRTHDEREKLLREEGLSEAELARLSSPIGLDLGGRTPQETAVSIAAEIVARRWKATGEPLRETDGPIHG